ncbi:response regulator transcription factor [Sphingomonas sp. M1-B02]|uniref:response regulator transcription factor n=1 Tax=Sphingomonas sp. M1-B02 TaxID=3114300 RepID=UPI00223F6E46|nr:response regulator transcription factor [Sphingomonas sp. S6-11]UZK66677.1 response regulator transcription factor [Sphingomonas sp. S6-11]
MARIIYVEDDALMGDIVKDILTQAGHLIGVIGHGTLAFETVAFKKPELVILDCGVPGMDGVQILEQMRRIPAIYLTPVLMLTARSSRADIERAMAAGANDYLVKPFAPEELVRRVAAMLSENDWRRKKI